MQKSIILRGPVLTQSGYGVHARQIARWLLSKEKEHGCVVKFQPLPWGNTPWLIDRERCDGLVGDILDRVSVPTDKFDLSIQVQLPNEWDTSLAKFNIGVTAAVETDRCNPKWIDCCNKMDKIIVPSKHSLENLKFYNNLTVDATVVPESFSDSCLTVKENSNLSLSTKFNFLIFGQITGNNPYNDRKNTFLTLKWLFEEFADNKDVGIVLKTNAGRNTIIDRNNIVTMMSNVIKETRKSPFPKLHIVHGDMTDGDVAGLYKNVSIKALVTATRGEGYGLPILEAAACSLPVIATNWSGHLDFLSRGKFIKTDYVLKDVHESRIDNNIFVKGSRWAEPNEASFKKNVRKFYSSYKVPQGWANDLSNVIQKEYSFKSISKAYDEIIK